MPRGEKLSIKSQICYYYDFGFASVIGNENEKSTNLTRHTLDASRIVERDRVVFHTSLSLVSLMQ